MTAMGAHVGIDFGTTNTTIGVAGRDEIELLPLPDGAGGSTPTWRTILFFERDAERGHGPTAGAPAIARYVAHTGEGRLIQSMKSHLASASFSRTTIFERSYSLEQLITVFLERLRAAAGRELGRRVVVGRPVRFWGAENGDDERRAVTRLRAALDAAGFEQAVLELEPVAAAASYAARLDHDELILVADFGGGTSDFTLVNVGPRMTPGDPGAVLASGGIGVGGDSFDARVIDAAIAPALGRGSSYLGEMGAATPVPAWLYGRLRRWHHMSILKTPETQRLLERIERGALDRVAIGRLMRTVEDDLGLPLHQAVERAKRELSATDRGHLGFAIPGGGAGGGVDADLTRASFEGLIIEELAAIAKVVDDVLATAGVAAASVDRVFATGGSSMVPSVRQLLEARFPDRLSFGDELTSVGWGLAARARQLFG
jgi:hypothetical chaperone protein